jgi:hypothetical protein
MSLFGVDYDYDCGPQHLVVVDSGPFRLATGDEGVEVRASAVET